MAIGKYIKEIGRGKDGARALTREHAADLMGQVLDGTVTDLEIGAFCLAMRIKGETPDEMAGFLDASYQRMHRVPVTEDSPPTIVIPSYNGARKLPLLTPLLGTLLAREGLPVLIHGTATESTRLFTSEVLAAMGVAAQRTITPIAPGELAFVPTALLCPGLQRLLEVRRVVNLRNPAHSLVKLMNPSAGPSIIVSSYTHPEYAHSMAATFELMGSHALLLRGSEGEAVANPRRTPAMQSFVQGRAMPLQEAQTGSLTDLPDLPVGLDAVATAAYIQTMLDGQQAIPEPIELQVAHILQLARTVQPVAAAT